MTTLTLNTLARPLTRTAHFSPVALIIKADAAYRQRRALRRLDAAALQDIGITRRQALGKAPIGAWDVPATWRA